jgi:hypothetical protein
MIPQGSPDEEELESDDEEDEWSAIDDEAGGETITHRDLEVWRDMEGDDDDDNSVVVRPSFLQRSEESMDDDSDDESLELESANANATTLDHVNTTLDHVTTTVDHVLFGREDASRTFVVDDSDDDDDDDDVDDVDDDDDDDDDSDEEEEESVITWAPDDDEDDDDEATLALSVDSPGLGQWTDVEPGLRVEIDDDDDDEESVMTESNTTNQLALDPCYQVAPPYTWGRRQSSAYQPTGRQP